MIIHPPTSTQLASRYLEGEGCKNKEHKKAKSYNDTLALIPSTGFGCLHQDRRSIASRARHSQGIKCHIEVNIGFPATILKDYPAGKPAQYVLPGIERKWGQKIREGQRGKGGIKEINK